MGDRNNQLSGSIPINQTPLGRVGAKWAFACGANNRDEAILIADKFAKQIEIAQDSLRTLSPPPKLPYNTEESPEKYTG